ncbi:MAG: hypothetical protein HY315_05040 [Acidobacteria bacterium]|nr:hypothetical protein [Acidobacteriota bacterium]
MAHPQIAAFARVAEGNAKATRKVEGQSTLLSRTMHAIAYDEIHDEFVVPQPFGHAVLTFRGSAKGEEPPLRVIQGPRTMLGGSSTLGIDPANNEILVPEGGKILVFPREANGDVAPIRILEPDTDQGRASQVAVDPTRNLMVVATQKGFGDSAKDPENVHLLIFNRTDQGKVKPKWVIGGPNTGLNSIFKMLVYPPRGEIIAAVPGPGSGEEMATETAFVGVWNIDDKGDVPPRWTVGGPYGTLRKPRGIALDPKNKSVIVSDKYLNAVLTFAFPEIF